MSNMYVSTEISVAIIIIFYCVLMHGLVLTVFPLYMNFCGHITKWTNEIISKPARPHID